MSIFKLLSMPVRADSYKMSQWLQYPEDTTHISSYIEARGGASKNVFFGAQALIKEYFLNPLTTEEAQFIYAKGSEHGEPINKDGWKNLINKYGGYAPVEIQAVPEGTYMDTKNVQFQIVNTDSEFAWLTSYLETSVLRGIWYPSTVASRSREMKVIIAAALAKSSDVPVNEQINFKLHDFGARGCTSTEQAALGGMAHLINFWGTDTFEGAIAADYYYNAGMSGFSIPASEHSSITSWGREGEIDAFKNMINTFGGPGKIYACVSDSYNIWNAIDMWKSIEDLILAKGGTLVVRPDSGDPLTVPVKVLQKMLDTFGYTVNSKGYKVLPAHVRVIQGDGLNRYTLPALINNILDTKISLENIAFGMGAGLLQDVNRDTYKYAMKASARKDSNGVWHDIYKDPITDSGKISKRGRLGLVNSCGLGNCSFKTVPESIAQEKDNNILRTIYRNGKLLIEDNFSSIRERAEVQPYEYEESEKLSRYE